MEEGRRDGRWKGFVVGGEERIEALDIAILLAALASRPIDPRPARLRGRSGFLQSTDPFKTNNFSVSIFEPRSARQGY